MSVRLTQTVKCAGCASKIPPLFLYEALKGISWPTSDRVLVGFEHADDAGVFQIAPDRALVATTDFFTPVVDDPYDYGRVAAANALSDIYAMGARPLFGLNILAYPLELGAETLRGILKGGADLAREAGIVIIGGHSVQSPELKYGMAIIGEAHPAEIKTIQGARPGDALILTKALGTGILNTAVKRIGLTEENYAELLASMLRLNRAASEVMNRFQAHGCTDITGFGLAGHGLEMARGSRAHLMIDTSLLPVLPGVTKAVAEGCVTGGDKTNREYTQSGLHCSISVGKLNEHVIFDPQTSGGLLIALDAEQAEPCVRALHEAGDRAATLIGRVLPMDEKVGHGTISFS